MHLHQLTIMYVISIFRICLRPDPQELISLHKCCLLQEKYFSCPPTHLVIPCYRTIVNTPGVEALLLLPEWHGANYWPYFFNGGQQKPHVVSVSSFSARFFFTNQATSKVFTADPKFKMLALQIKS
jgi:hypothetical protein